ncbi:MAG: hypothetical protein KDD69_10630 [Bdellovibrionales bacterium]|nr:hypothetical protein [Bdellovibrionales bacterium]
MSSASDDALDPSLADHGHAVIRSLLSAIPMGGGAAVEFFNVLVTPPIERRRREWMERVAKMIHGLNEKVELFDASRLGHNERFVSTLLSATSLAAKTHKHEKLEALQNAVGNAACGVQPDEELDEIFLNYIERFTPLHLRLLKIFNEGFVWSNDGYPQPGDLELPPMLVPSVGSYEPFRELDRSVLSVILRELVQFGMIQHWVIKKVTRTLPDDSVYCEVNQWRARSSSELYVQHGVDKAAHQKSGAYVTKTTHNGGNFVRFVTAPIHLNAKAQSV